jgi:hypothetical protein
MSWRTQVASNPLFDPSATAFSTSGQGCLVAASPQSSSTQFALWADTSTSTTAPRQAGVSPWSYFLEISYIGPTAVKPGEVNIEWNNGVLIEPGPEQSSPVFLIGDEIFVVVSWSNIGAMVASRGMMDTVPPLVEHAIGTKAWFLGYIEMLSASQALMLPQFGIDAVRDANTQLDVRALTLTGVGRLLWGDALSSSLTLASRALRPIAPAALTAEDRPSTSETHISWFHRNRLSFNSGLLGQEPSDDGPESGTTYELKIYEVASTPVLLRTVTTSDTFLDYKYAEELADRASAFLAKALLFEVKSLRDGYESWQTHKIIMSR